MAGVALVTGAGDRLGKAMALALGANGYDVAIHYHRSEQKAEDVAATINASGAKAVTLQADLSAEANTEALIAKTQKALGPVNLLVNSASVFENDGIDNMTRESWDTHIETNLRTPLKLSQEFAKQAIGNNNSIINIVDQRVWKLTPQFLSYTLSKAGLLHLTKTLAQSLGPQGIRVNAIGPGPTLRNARQSEDDWRKQNEATILGYGATPDDIVGALLYLVGAKAVTGQMIAVDGGQHLTWQTPDVMINE